MGKVIRIARTELNILFYSPIAWFVLIIFIIQSGIVFFDNLTWLVRLQESRGSFMAEMYGGVTNILFCWNGGSFYPKVQETLYLYLPLLTMGLISRELSSGSIKLLLSSPVKSSQIVLGKFGAMVVYCIFFIMILLLFVITAFFSVQNMDVGKALSGSLSTFLLICVYAAIGLYMSSLTGYQVVAAIATLATFAALNYVGEVGQKYEIVRAITYVISLPLHAAHLNRGLISSRDMVYFICVVLLFLVLTVMRMDDSRQTRTVIFMASRYSLVVLIFFSIVYFSSRPSLIFYHDLTSNKVNTISPITQHILMRVKKPITIISYTNLLGARAYLGLPEAANLNQAFWEPYVRFKSDMHFVNEYYYDSGNSAIFTYRDNIGLDLHQVAAKEADSYGYKLSMFLDPNEMKTKIDLKKEDYRFVRLLKCGERKAFLRTFEDNINNGQPTEQEIADAFAQLVENPTSVYFTTGHKEKNIYKNDADQINITSTEITQRHALINQGFDADTISLVNREFPEGTDIVAIVAPKTTVGKTEEEKLFRYLDNGGNMLIAGDIGSVKALNPILKKLGVSLLDGVIIQPNEKFRPQRIEANYSDCVGKFFNTTNLKEFGKDSLNKLIMDGATGLDYTIKSNFKTSVIASSDIKKAWFKAESIGAGMDTFTFHPERGDRKQVIPTVLALRRNYRDKEQRIIITSDADFMNNHIITESSNDVAVLEMFKWLNYGIFPINTEKKQLDLRLNIDRKDIPPFQILFIGVLPCFLLVYSFTMLTRRKHR